MYILTTLAQIKYDALPNVKTDNAVANITTVVFGITASIAFLVIVISGFRYILAHGDPNATAQAKNSILYAVIGLLVSLAAFSIVTFIIKGVG